jgi:hypothetical protein
MAKPRDGKKHLRSFRQRAIILVAVSFIVPPVLASFFVQFFM